MSKRVKHYVLCVNNRGYKASLEVRKIYEAILDKDASTIGMMRIIDESGEDYLYQAALFVSINLPDAAKDLFAHPVRRKQLPNPPAM